MKYLVITIFSAISFWGCKQYSNNHITTENKSLQPETTTNNLSQPSKTKTSSDTIKNQEKTVEKWAFKKEILSLFSSEKSDDFYNYGQLKVGSIESGKFVRIPKKDSPYTGFEKMVIKFPYFTVEQTYREGDFTNYEFITFKKEAQSIYLYKYAVDYTNIQNLEEDVPGLRLDQKTIGKVQIENVTIDFLTSLRSER